MLKKIWPYYLILFAFNAIEGSEIYSLKSTYEMEVLLDGTDQSSIKEGMKRSLSSLLINLSGTSLVLDDKAIQGIINSPEIYITQYKLDAVDEKIVASFVFQGDSLRSYLSENELPLWFAEEPLVLSYFPCRQAEYESNQDDELTYCIEMEKELLNLSTSRNSRITRPLMDLKDIRDLEFLSSISAEKFMTKMSRRYGADNWLICLTKDKFGLLMDTPSCFSSENKKPSSLEMTFNYLLNEINLKQSLVVDRDVINESQIEVIGIDSFMKLEKVLQTLDSQVLIFNLSLEELEGNSAYISLSHYGSKVDLKNLLMIHADFKEIKFKSQDIISYQYTNT